MAATVIPCIFNRGCSAAKFLFVPRARVDIHTPPLPAVEGRGGFGGGARFLHVYRSGLTPKRGVEVRLEACGSIRKL